MYGSVSSLQKYKEHGPRWTMKPWTFLWLMVGSVSLCSILIGLSFGSEQVEPDIMVVASQFDTLERLPQHIGQENTLGCFPVPSITVPQCPNTTSIEIAQNLVDRGPFPTTQVDLCYTSSAFRMVFTALNENSFYVNPSYTHNDDIWRYNVFETFLALGIDDPVEYFEFEVSPTNQSYSAYILNPHKDFSAPVGHFYVGKNESEARDLGIIVSTTTNQSTSTWISQIDLALSLFDVAEPLGTLWRMNFMRKITNESFYPAQQCGAWNAPNQYNFHETPCFGLVRFV